MPSEVKGPYADAAMSILRESSALIENDHFVYISGDHGSGWIDKDAIFPRTERIDLLCRDLAALVREWNAEVVCGPAMGGLIVAEWTAHALGIASVYTEHDPAPHLSANDPGASLRGRFILRRGYDALVRGKRVLVVDDIVNTGHSLRETAQAVTAAGGVLVGGGCLVSRGNVGAAGLGLDRYAWLLEYNVPAWPAANCPLCQSGVPVNTRYAHGSEYLERETKK